MEQSPVTSTPIEQTPLTTNKAVEMFVSLEKCKQN